MGFLFDLMCRRQDGREAKTGAKLGKLVWQNEDRRDYAAYADNETILRQGWKGGIRQGKEKP